MFCCLSACACLLACPSSSFLHLLFLPCHGRDAGLISAVLYIANGVWSGVDVVSVDDVQVRGER